MLHKWRLKCHARRERYLLTVFLKTYNKSQAPEGAGIFNGITKDRQKSRFHRQRLPYDINSGCYVKTERVLKVWVALKFWSYKLYQYVKPLIRVRLNLILLLGQILIYGDQNLVQQKQCDNFRPPLRSGLDLIIKLVLSRGFSVQDFSSLKMPPTVTVCDLWIYNNTEINIHPYPSKV